MNKFNLTEEPWIPCLMLETNETKDLSLFDVFSRAHEIKEITDNSPLVLVSLHRLLLAILHRNFGPKSFDDWKELWRKGCWDAEKLKSYFDKCKDRFNLFDEERPFYQYPRVLKAGGKEADIVPLELLMQEKVAGNNATLFDHSFDENPKGYSFAISARYLLARQAFSIGFGKNYPFYLSDSSIIRGFTVLTLGKNLFETLALNLIVYRNDKPIPTQEDDEGNILDKPFGSETNCIELMKKIL
jgi:CRISPR system Cascade subunit CasA